MESDEESEDIQSLDDFFGINDIRDLKSSVRADTNYFQKLKRTRWNRELINNHSKYFNNKRKISNLCKHYGKSKV